MGDVVLQQHYYALGLPRIGLYATAEDGSVLAKTWYGCRPTRHLKDWLVDTFSLWVARRRG